MTDEARDVSDIARDDIVAAHAEGTVRRLRPKLMTIRSFAWTFDFVAGWLAWAKALPPWQTVQRSFDRLKVWVRVLQRRARPRKQSPSTVARPAPVRASPGKGAHPAAVP